VGWSLLLPLISDKRAGAGRRRGVPQGCCCQGTHDYKPVTALWGGRAGGVVLLSLSANPKRTAGE